MYNVASFYGEGDKNACLQAENDFTDACYRKGQQTPEPQNTNYWFYAECCTLSPPTPPPPILPPRKPKPPGHPKHPPKAFPG
jgi:hypothetical protein